jgi:hypothetical protein
MFRFQTLSAALSCTMMSLSPGEAAAAQSAGSDASAEVPRISGDIGISASGMVAADPERRLAGTSGFSGEPGAVRGESGRAGAPSGMAAEEATGRSRRSFSTFTFGMSR